jgi:hypothetical protein
MFWALHGGWDLVTWEREVLLPCWDGRGPDRRRGMCCRPAVLVLVLGVPRLDFGRRRVESRSRRDVV